jgi:transposase-like protein
MKVTEQQKAEAVAAYLGGASLAEAGAGVGVSAPTVRKWVLAAGHETRNAGTPEAPDEAKAEAIAKYVAGASLGKAGAAVGVRGSTVMKWLEKAGIRRRSRGNRAKENTP